ncbi:unnamed protein product [Trichogramma brassicae]|uniref:Helix-turn-helix domain-containing protein n=1 Tax=Trichogramma brassicae TaxID=86971 RepID=A0A6H5IT81_9HYME|nr:unnamed protein product [Trichogramma brassicae]
MDDLETFCLSELKKHQCNPIFYVRYVDDTVICVKREHIDLVLKTFNGYDKNLQFTHEIEKDGALNFLDISLIRNGSGLITDWYRKPTNTTRILAFDSRHTAQQKKNIVFNLVDRTVLLADHRFHDKNLIYVKNILRLNGYLEKFSNENISSRLREIKHRSGGRVRRLSDSEPLKVIQLPWINGFFPRAAVCSRRQLIASFARLANARHTCAAAQFDSHTCAAMHANIRARALMPRTEHTCDATRLRLATVNATGCADKREVAPIRQAQGNSEKRHDPAVAMSNEKRRRSGGRDENENGADPLRVRIVELGRNARMRRCTPTHARCSPHDRNHQ